MKSILVTPRGYQKYGTSERRELENLGYVMDVNETGKPLSKAIFEKKAIKATGLIVGVDQVDATLLEKCENLKAIVKFGVGLDNIDLTACKQKGIKVGRCLGTNSNAVAEYTIGMMFACARHLVSNAIEVKDHKWNKPTGIELYGKKIGIIGFGAVGKHVARIANGLGMEVIVYDIFSVSQEVLDEYSAKQASFGDVIENSDFITLHLPLTLETRNLISKEEFKKMKSDAIIVNSARGGIIDEKALYNALKNKEIYACASDVFTSEPPENDAWISDLISLDNFILSAHIGSRSKEAEIKTVKVATQTLKDLLAD